MRATAFAILWICACNPDSHSGPTRTVTVSLTDTVWSPDGSSREELPEPGEVAVSVWTGSDWIAAALIDGGRFASAEVPDGPVTVEHCTGDRGTSLCRYVVSGSEIIDLGVDRGTLTNADASEAGPGTRLILDLTGLPPWNLNADSLAIFAPEHYALGWFDGGAAEGATTLHAEIDWDGFFPRLVSPPGGMRLVLVHYRDLYGQDGSSHSEPVSAATIDAFELRDGVDNFLSATMTAPEPARRYEFDWNIDVGQVAAVHPDADLHLATFAITANAVLPGMLGLPVAFGYSTFDIGLDLADPFPAELTRTVSTLARFSVDGVGIADRFAVFDAEEAAGQSVGAPIGSVLDPSIEGPFFPGLPGPTLSWAEPSGDAIGYRVDLLRPSDDFADPIMLFTSGPPLEIPPGLVRRGGSYAFRIRALWGPGRSVDRPFRWSVPRAHADALTDAFLIL